jgi:hypothetical protein
MNGRLIVRLMNSKKCSWIFFKRRVKKKKILSLIMNKY